MGNFAPTYMTTYDTDGPDVNLGNLALSASTVAGNAAAGTAIGNITGGAGGIAAGKSVYSVVSPTDGSVQIAGSALQKGATNVSAGTVPVTIQEDNQYAQKSPHRTTVNVTFT